MGAVQIRWGVQSSWTFWVDADTLRSGYSWAECGLQLCVLTLEFVLLTTSVLIEVATAARRGKGSIGICIYFANPAPATKKIRRSPSWGPAFFFAREGSGLVLRRKQVHPSRPGAGAPVNSRRERLSRTAAKEKSCTYYQRFLLRPTSGDLPSTRCRKLLHSSALIALKLLIIRLARSLHC